MLKKSDILCREHYIYYEKNKFFYVRWYVHAYIIGRTHFIDGEIDMKYIPVSLQEEIRNRPTQAKRLAPEQSLLSILHTII